MKMIGRIIRLGWKNVWRNPTRSAVVVIAVMLGTWAGTFLAGFFNGMVQDYLKNQFEISVGHIRISHPQFEDLYDPNYNIPEAQRHLDSLRAYPEVTRLLYQSLASGLAQSATNSYGVSINGVYTDEEARHPIANYLTVGTFLGGNLRNPVVVGDDLAERLGLEMHSKMVLNFQDVNGNITAGAFRIGGIFDTISDRFDDGNVYLPAGTLNRLLGREGLVHRIRLDLQDFTRADLIADTLSTRFPELKVASWSEISPELSYVFDMTDISLYVVMVIIILALIFSIVNTMLMAILERTRELGMLMAIGMNRMKLFFMILSETFFLTMVGAPAGFLLSWITISWTGQTGINLTAWAEGLGAYGFSTIIYPELGITYYLNITLLIAAAALLSALYPAWKTMKLNPVEAIRKL